MARHAGAAGVGAGEGGEDADGRGLARAVGAEQSKDGARLDRRSRPSSARTSPVGLHEAFGLDRMWIEHCTSHLEHCSSCSTLFESNARRTRTSVEAQAGGEGRDERRPLTRDAIVDAALMLLDRDGLAGLSMRRLAEELGSAPPRCTGTSATRGAARPAAGPIVGETQVPDPDPANWQEQVKEIGARVAPAADQRHRDAAQISLGRIPVGPALDAGARALPRGAVAAGCRRA